jgi:hypothetical protein
MQISDLNKERVTKPDYRGDENWKLAWPFNTCNAITIQYKVLTMGLVYCHVYSQLVEFATLIGGIFCWDCQISLPNGIFVVVCTYSLGTVTLNR